MKSSDFLNKLKKEEKLKIIDISEEVSLSYEKKGQECRDVAKLAYNAEIYENTISEAYYSIYNSVLSLFYKCGIKCENHSASVLLIKNLFHLGELCLIFSEFKKDRIDNQYYILIIGTEPINKDKCAERIKTAKEFNIKIRVYSNNLKLQEINKIREIFKGELIIWIKKDKTYWDKQLYL